MAWRFVKQPNGLLARFSDVVDDFTDVNLTTAQALELCKSEYGLSEADAERKVRGGTEDWKPWTHAVHGSGHDRWDESIRIVQEVHGEHALTKLLADVSSITSEG